MNCHPADLATGWAGFESRERITRGHERLGVGKGYRGGQLTGAVGTGSRPGYSVRLVAKGTPGAAGGG